ncbi:hypothetical protein AK830_g1467 [Neonectria ditissima]|uniref:Uncharacterized protein n=1 Tax=Neonectria ditissima TaxID=78410 RepID=A0A0P7BMV2_9HYPO|nr:hypothetical protein AK830_g1467 [Neonectria ditissima]
MAQTITVDRELSVTLANGSSRPRASSAYSLFNHRPEPSIDNAPSLRRRAKSSSNLLDLEPKLEFEDNTVIDEDGNFRRTNGLAELIDFLRNHAPPEGNFMSIPDDTNGDKGRWAKIRKIALRSKSVSRSPDPIRLPDSAISGVTTGGHRHIAISIPLDASPFGRSPRTQYPVYQNRQLRPLAGRHGPTRAVLNEKGVVTVLRTVTEESIASSLHTRRTPGSQSPASPTASRPRGASLGTPYSSASSTDSNGHGNSGYFGISTGSPRTVPTDQFRRANSSRELQSHGQTGPGSRNSNRQDNFPTRGSSLVVNRFVFPPTSSIDAMMSQTMPQPDTLPIALSPNRNNPKDEPHQSSSSKSILSLSDDEPILANAKMTKKSTLEEYPLFKSSKKTEEPIITVITRNPLGPSDGQNSPTPSVKSTQSQSRRDKVRDKKRRDVEALRNKRNSIQSLRSQRSQQQEETETQEFEELKELATIPQDENSNSPLRKEKPPPLPLKSANRPSLCPIMVVSDVQPSPTRSPATLVQPDLPQPSPPLQSPVLHHNFPKPPKTKPQLRPKPIQRVSSMSGRSGATSPASFNSSNNPTPPQSVKGSPVQKQGNFDRSSLQSSLDRASKGSSVDRMSKQGSIPRLSKGSLERLAKQNSVDRMAKQGSIERLTKGSLERLSKQTSADRMAKQGSIDRLSRGSLDRLSKQDSLDQTFKKSFVEQSNDADRTSLSRRREWNATREQERKGPGSRLGSRTMPRPLVMSGDDVDEPKNTGAPNPTDKELIRHYDVYREYRIREMERRLRRLERNGDVWLRALVPVLENLNRTLAHAQGDQDRAQGWVSDEDMVGSLSPPRGRASFSAGNGRSRAMPGAGVSEREFLEHLVRTKEELEAGNVSDDMSGFDTIEPLMRELAGRSRLNFEARSMALAEEDAFRGF